MKPRLPRSLVRLVRRAALPPKCRRTLLRVLARGVALAVPLETLRALAQVGIRYYRGDRDAVWLVDMVTAGAL